MKPIIFFLLIGVATARFLGKGFFRGAAVQRDVDDEASVLPSQPRRRNKILQIRGGSGVASSAANASAIDESQHHHHHSMCHVVVSTSVGSAFLDKKKRLQVERNSTVSDLKQLVEKKFPGSPPAALQKLFFGMRILNDSEIVSNLTTMSPVPILLDMMTGTSVYNKTMSITQALEAYVASTVHQAYLGDKMKAIYAAISAGDEDLTSLTTETLDTAVYREMFDSLNRTLYEKYAEDIALALEEEKEPETESADTMAWRSGKKEVSPLNEALAKQFDLNWRGVKFFAYYSILLAVFAYYGTTSSLSTNFLLMMVPVLWVSKLRHLRLASKILLYLVLPILPKLDFLMPLLPAPYQAIAEASQNWSIEGDEPILPKPKSKGTKDVAKALSSFFGSSEEDVVVGGLGAREAARKAKKIQKDEEEEEDVSESEEEETEDEVEEKEDASEGEDEEAEPEEEDEAGSDDGEEEKEEEEETFEEEEEAAAEEEEDGGDDADE